jgi:hypothetical protein
MCQTEQVRSIKNTVGLRVGGYSYLKMMRSHRYQIFCIINYAALVVERQKGGQSLTFLHTMKRVPSVLTGSNISLLHSRARLARLDHFDETSQSFAIHLKLTLN